MAPLRKGTLEELPVSPRPELYNFSNRTRYTNFYSNPYSPSNFYDSRKLSHQPDHISFQARHEVRNMASPLSHSPRLFTCANPGQCMQLLERARPSDVIQQIHVEISYDGAWKLDKLQLAKTLAHRAPRLKRLQLKCFVPLRGERKIPGPFADFTIDVLKLHPLLKKLVHSSSEDKLHVYYIFVSSEHELGPTVPIAPISTDTHVTDCRP
jgi:hypothetical protein